MMPNQKNTAVAEQLFFAFLFAVTLGGLFYSQNTYAEITIPTLDQVIGNISETMPQLMRLVTSLAYILGMFFVIMGVLELKHFGEQRTMMSSEHSLKKPIIYLLVGAALIYLPSSIDAGLFTFWHRPVPYGYVPEVANPWSELIRNCFIIIQFLGVFAFIRGLVTLTYLAGHGSQPGTFARGITFIIGGILCINMYDTVRMVFATLGLDTSILGGT